MANNLFVLDSDGIIIEVNKTAAIKLQYKPTELTGKSIMDFICCFKKIDC